MEECNIQFDLLTRRGECHGNIENYSVDYEDDEEDVEEKRTRNNPVDNLF